MNFAIVWQFGSYLKRSRSAVLLCFLSFFFLTPVLLCSLRTNCTAVTFFRKYQTQALTGKNDKTYFDNRGNHLGNLISCSVWVKLIWIHLDKSTHPSLQGAASLGEVSRSVTRPVQAIFARTWSSSVLVWDFVTNSRAGAQVSRCWQMDSLCFTRC